MHRVSLETSPTCPIGFKHGERACQSIRAISSVSRVLQEAGYYQPLGVQNLETTEHEVPRSLRGETGDPEKTHPTSDIVRHLRKSGVIPPGIEPGSHWWVASRLTARPPLASVKEHLCYGRSAPPMATRKTKTQIACPFVPEHTFVWTQVPLHGAVVAGTTWTHTHLYKSIRFPRNDEAGNIQRHIIFTRLACDIGCLRDAIIRASPSRPVIFRAPLKRNEKEFRLTLIPHLKFAVAGIVNVDSPLEVRGCRHREQPMASGVQPLQLGMNEQQNEQVSKAVISSVRPLKEVKACQGFDERIELMAISDRVLVRKKVKVHCVRGISRDGHHADKAVAVMSCRRQAATQTLLPSVILQGSLQRNAKSERIFSAQSKQQFFFFFYVAGDERQFQATFDDARRGRQGSLIGRCSTRRVATLYCEAGLRRRPDTAARSFKGAWLTTIRRLSVSQPSVDFFRPSAESDSQQSDLRRARKFPVLPPNNTNFLAHRQMREMKDGAEIFLYAGYKALAGNEELIGASKGVCLQEGNERRRRNIFVRWLLAGAERRVTPGTKRDLPTAGLLLFCSRSAYACVWTTGSMDLSPTAFPPPPPNGRIPPHVTHEADTVVALRLILVTASVFREQNARRSCDTRGKKFFHSTLLAQSFAPSVPKVLQPRRFPPTLHADTWCQKWKSDGGSLSTHHTKVRRKFSTLLYAIFKCLEFRVLRRRFDFCASGAEKPPLRRMAMIGNHPARTANYSRTCDKLASKRRETNHTPATSCTDGQLQARLGNVGHFHEGEVPRAIQMETHPTFRARGFDRSWLVAVRVRLAAASRGTSGVPPGRREALLPLLREPHVPACPGFTPPSTAGDETPPGYSPKEMFLTSLFQKKKSLHRCRKVLRGTRKRRHKLFRETAWRAIQKKSRRNDTRPSLLGSSLRTALNRPGAANITQQQSLPPPPSPFFDQSSPLPTLPLPARSGPVPPPFPLPRP
ncbi:hypothetical protein PR048_026057 [Dryococelus australis]|uniref:Uncharacterized protein n=1 Tax=Dryococelus australis TaxID=614101 RepID=A0ABQ9GKB4_9NEOP|nr:hypothetical protein PR048_026057 [Dryococelus australis]